MAGEITLSANLSVANGNFRFPGGSGKAGVNNLAVDQATAGGGAPGWFEATNAAQGTLLDLSTLPITLGGWVIIVNPDTAAIVTWGPDNGSGTLVIAGAMKPGEPVLFRNSASQSKYRFKSSVASTKIQVYALNL